MKIIKNSLVIILTALFSSWFVYGSYTIYAEDGLSQIDEEGLNHLEIFAIYHQSMNELFNTRIRMFISLTDSQDFFTNAEKQKRLVMPVNIDRENDGVDEIVEKCKGSGEDEVNLSSYCISMEGLKMYKRYVLKLNTLKEEVDFSDYDGTLNSLVFENAKKIDAIDKEILNARSTFEGALSVYQEFMQAYPMHKKYQEIIERLLRYKMELKDVRNETAFFPLKFVDSTSLHCE